MDNGKQISVFLENKPGRLANVLSALARQKVNVLALTVMDSHEHSVLRFVPDSQDRTRSVLKELSIPFAESEVLLGTQESARRAWVHLRAPRRGTHQHRVRLLQLRRPQRPNGRHLQTRQRRQSQQSAQRLEQRHSASQTNSAAVARSTSLSSVQNRTRIEIG